MKGERDDGAYLAVVAEPVSVNEKGIKWVSDCTKRKESPEQGVKNHEGRYYRGELGSMVLHLTEQSFILPG